MIAALADNIPSAAKALDVSVRTVWQLVADGELATFKCRGRTLIRADVLRGFVDRCSAPQAATRGAANSRCGIATP